MVDGGFGEDDAQNKLIPVSAGPATLELLGDDSENAIGTIFMLIPHYETFWQ